MGKRDDLRGEGKRHRRPFDPGRYRSGVPPCPQGQREALEAAEREAARQLANPFEDAPVTVGSDADAPVADLGAEDAAE